MRAGGGRERSMARGAGRVTVFIVLMVVLTAAWCGGELRAQAPSGGAEADSSGAVPTPSGASSPSGTAPAQPAPVAADSGAASPAIAGRSGNPEDVFRAAGASYEAGRYEEAEAAYERLLADGHDDPRVHYNLGNARFKQGKLGPAILAYERALARDPSDADARENLAYADLQIADKVGVPEDEFPARVLSSLGRHFDPDRATLGFAIFCLLAGLCAAPLWMRPGPAARRVFGAAAATAGAIAVLCGAVAVIELAAPRTEHAIVLAPSADGRSSPAADGTVLFTVHEGLKVQIRGERPGWIQIGVPNGDAGWIESSQAERI